MNPFEILASQPGVPRLGSTLLHFLWQGVAIAALYALARKRAATSLPSVRYVLGCVSLAAMAAAPLVTWWMLGPPPTGLIPASPAAPLSATAGRVVPGLTDAFPAVSTAAATPLLPWVVALWLVGVTALWVRLIGGWILAARLRSRLVTPASAVWQHTFHRLKVRMRVSGRVPLVLSPLVHAPAVVGWLRPVVLAPVAALAALPLEQMEALLLHELAHIRRHDYLVNLLQSAVEALLFYHPAVWWVSSHMRAERELCCDDAAVSASGDTIVYARALAGLSSLCPPVVMAANGGSLAHRIARLLGRPRPAPRTVSGPGILAAALLLVIAAVALFAQPASRPRFEVASIKRAGDTGPMTMRPLPNGLTGTATLKQLIQRAYAAQGFQIASGPEWIQSERYAVEAKAAGTVSHDQASLMLRSLLVERFQLESIARRESFRCLLSSLPAAAPSCHPPNQAVVMTRSNRGPTRKGGRLPPPGSERPLSRCGSLSVILETGGVRLSGGKVPMPELVRMLSVVLGRTIVDRTGLSGPFDVRLDFLPDDSTPHLPPPPPDAAAANVMSPPVLTALPEQLGLRLESVKGPVDVIVIDHAERPSAN